MSRSFKPARFLTAISVTTICAGCAHQPTQAVLDRDLPPAPAFLAPVKVPPLKRGDDPRAKLAETRDKLGEANARLTGAAQWYENIRAHEAGETAP